MSTYHNMCPLKASKFPFLCRARPYEKPKAEWLRGTSHIIKGTLDQVSITDNNDSSISWYNARDMPAKVTAYTPTVVNELLEGLPITAQDPQYVIHPGGPAILKGPQELLGLPQSQNQVFSRPAHVRKHLRQNDDLHMPEQHRAGVSRYQEVNRRCILWKESIWVSARKHGIAERHPHKLCPFDSKCNIDTVSSGKPSQASMPLQTCI